MDVRVGSREREEMLIALGPPQKENAEMLIKMAAYDFMTIGYCCAAIPRVYGAQGPGAFGQ